MPHDQRSRRRPTYRPSAEALEARRVLTGGAGAVFADLPATISTPGATVALPFTIDPAHFKVPHGTMTLGIDVSGNGTTPASPLITSVLDAKGHPLPIHHTTYPASVSKLLGGKTQSSAVTVTLNLSALRHGKSQSFSVVVASAGGSTGSLHVGFYLPGDAAGNGVVTQSDIKTIQAAQNIVAGGSTYNVDVDANRDGQITKADLAMARGNLGVSTTIDPTLTGAPSPASAVDAKTLNTSIQDLGFSGVATPGATVTATAISGGAPTVKATAGSDGTYNMVLHLSAGANSFTISSTDAFGQTNTGVIPQINYVPKS